MADIALARALAKAREQASELFSLIQDEEKAKIKRWEDEKPAITSLVSSLSKSNDIIKAQRKQAKAQLQALQEKLDKQQQQIPSKGQNPINQQDPSHDLEDLQIKLIDLNNKVLDIDFTIKKVTDELSSSLRPEEKEIHSTMLVALQDTKRMLQSEISGIRSNIMRMDATARIEAERQVAEESGFSTLSRLDEQLVHTSARLDRAKQQMYFPEAKGYRFSAGGSGVYFAARDLFISELSGRFDLDLELATRPDGTKVVRVTAALGGAAGEDDNSIAEQRRARPAGLRSYNSSHSSEGGATTQRSTSAAQATRSEAGVDSSRLAEAATTANYDQGLSAVQASENQVQAMRRHTIDDVHSASSSKDQQSASRHIPPPDIAESPSSSVKPLENMAAMAAAAAAAARELAAKGQASGQLPVMPSGPATNRGHAPKADSSPGGVGALAPVGASPLPPLSQNSEKGEIVSSFFSSLGRKKDKLKNFFSSSSGGGNGSKVMGTIMEGNGKERDEGRGSISKLARSIANKADHLSDKIRDGLSVTTSSSRGLSSSTRQSSDKPSSFTADASSDSHTTSHSSNSMNAKIPTAALQPNIMAAAASAAAAAAAAAAASNTHMRSASELPASLQKGSVDLQSESSAPAAAPSMVTGSTSSTTPPVGSIGSTSVEAERQPTPAVAAAAPSSEGTWGSESLGMEGFEGRPSRKGMFLQLLCEQAEIIGERGTKVPDISMKEFLLEMEVAMTAVLEYSSIVGWQSPEKVNLSIITLNHKLRGSSLPLPSMALRALLNLYLPGMLTETLISALPSELGAYVAISAEPIRLSGEIRVLGQQLSTYVASLSPQPVRAYSDSARREAEKQAIAAASRARALLGLSDAQARAICELFAGLSGAMIPDRSGKPTSINELCHFYVQYSQSQMWTALCGVCNRALQVCFNHFGVRDRFTFGRFMELAVARLARKPLRVLLTVHRLSAALDADAALMTLRDFFERSAKELYKKSQAGGDNAAVPREPLESQLETLALWYSVMSTHLRNFKSKFKKLRCSLLANADRDVFQVGAEALHYDGPLNIKVPLDVMMDPDNNFVWDIKLPEREEYENSTTSLLGEMLMTLAETNQQNGAASSTSGGNSMLPGTVSSGGGAPLAGPALVAELDRLLKASSKKVKREADNSAEGTGTKADEREGTEGSGLEDGGGLELPLLANPVIGQLSIKRLALTLKMDEERVVELLSKAVRPAANAAAASHSSHAGSADRISTSSAFSSATVQAVSAATGVSLEAGAHSVADTRLAARLLGCYGDLFTASLDVGWKAEPDEDGTRPPKCMLTVANNEVTRVQANVESLMFQSSVSPKLAIRMLYAVIAGLQLRFSSADSMEMRFLHTLFSQLHEYLGKEALDVTACLSAEAQVLPMSEEQLKLRAPPRRVSAAGQAANEASTGSTEQRLRIVLNGGSAQQGLSHVRPFSLVNDISLFSMLDSYKLLGES